MGLASLLPLKYETPLKAEQFVVFYPFSYTELKLSWVVDISVSPFHHSLNCSIYTPFFIKLALGFSVYRLQLPRSDSVEKLQSH